MADRIEALHTHTHTHTQLVCTSACFCCCFCWVYCPRFCDESPLRPNTTTEQLARELCTLCYYTIYTACLSKMKLPVQYICMWCMFSLATGNEAQTKMKSRICFVLPFLLEKQKEKEKKFTVDWLDRHKTKLVFAFSFFLLLPWQELQLDPTAGTAWSWLADWRSHAYCRYFQLAS